MPVVARSMHLPVMLRDCRISSWLSGRSAAGFVAARSILLSDSSGSRRRVPVSPGGGCAMVAVELEEVVGGVDQSPL